MHFVVRREFGTCPRREVLCIENNVQDRHHDGGWENVSGMLDDIKRDARRGRPVVVSVTERSAPHR